MPVFVKGSFVKPTLLVLGYLLAWLIADRVLALHIWLTADDRRGADGMYAFGDMLLFLGVFGLLALLPTGAVIYFLRARQPLWNGVSRLALALATTAPLALIVFALFNRASASDGALAVLAGTALLRLLASPLLCCAFLACAALTPASPSRKRLFWAGAIEGATVLCMVLRLLLAAH